MLKSWLETYLIYFALMEKAVETVREQDHSITISPVGPKFSLIWLHGLGDSSEGFLDYFQHKSSPVQQLGARVRLL
jgi:hypothetical protein